MVDIRNLLLKIAHSEVARIPFNRKIPTPDSEAICPLFSALFPQFGGFFHANKCREVRWSRAILSGNEREIFQRREWNSSQREDRKRNSLQVTEALVTGKLSRTCRNGIAGDGRVLLACLQRLRESSFVIWRPMPGLREFGQLRAGSRKRIRPLAFQTDWEPCAIPRRLAPIRPWCPSGHGALFCRLACLRS